MQLQMMRMENKAKRRNNSGARSKPEKITRNEIARTSNSVDSAAIKEEELHQKEMKELR